MVVGDKSGIDLSESRPSLQAQLREHEDHLKALPDDCPPLERARVQLDIAETRLALLNKKEAWDAARELFDHNISPNGMNTIIDSAMIDFNLFILFE